MALEIFLSYASEDQQFADAIAAALNGAFKASVNLTIMSRNPLGVNYRDLIDDGLDKADILLVVATGHQKLSHSFTGYEVGYFRRSQDARAYIDEEKGSEREIERLIIPIAMFADVPAPISDLQSLGISEKDMFLFDLTMADAVRKIPSEKENKFSDLFFRIDDIQKALEGAKRPQKTEEEIRKSLCKEADSFYHDLIKLMSVLPVRKDYPKTRLTLHLPPDFAKNIAIDDRVLVSCKGSTAGIFAGDQLEQFVNWPAFSQGIASDEEIVQNWKDALFSIVESTLGGKFVETD
jgi:hypothetical protein